MSSTGMRPAMMESVSGIGISCLAAPHPPTAWPRVPPSPRVRGEGGVRGYGWLGVLRLVIAVAQHPARQVARVLAVFHQHLAVDNGHVHALGRLLDALGAGREVVQHFERQ